MKTLTSLILGLVVLLAAPSVEAQQSSLLSAAYQKWQSQSENARAIFTRAVKQSAGEYLTALRREQVALASRGASSEVINKQIAEIEAIIADPNPRIDLPVAVGGTPTESRISSLLVTTGRWTDGRHVFHFTADGAFTSAGYGSGKWKAVSNKVQLAWAGNTPRIDSLTFDKSGGTFTHDTGNVPFVTAK